MFYICFTIFFIYIKIYKNSSAKYYQEKIKKKLVKDTKTFIKKKKEEMEDMDVKVTKISQKMKKSLLSIE